jgi:predicted TIM-barrel fold metal-dependent hydrolase
MIENRIFGDANRRQFLTGLAAASTAAMLPLAESLAQPAAPHGLIDTHHHFYSPEYKQASDEFNSQFHIPPIPLVSSWTPEQSIAEMDKGGIQLSVLSLPSTPGLWFNKGPEMAVKMARATNDYAASVVAKYPKRFALWAALPMLDIDASLKEIAHAFDDLKADGIGLQTSYGDKWPGDPTYAPVFEELNRRHAVVYFHPLAPACCGRLATFAPNPAVLEVPFDTVRSITSLLMTGSLAKYRNIKWVWSHGGGAMPMLSGRLNQFVKDDPKKATYAPNGVYAELEKLYYDTANAVWKPTWGGLRSLIPTSQIVFGTDYPYFFVDQVAELGKRGLSPKDLQAVYSGNAKKLLPRLAKVMA